MKDDDAVGDEGCGDGSDEGGVWLIFSSLRGFEDRWTNGQTDTCDCTLSSQLR